MRTKKTDPIQDCNALQYMRTLYDLLELTDIEKVHLNLLFPGMEKIKGSEIKPKRAAPKRKLTEEGMAFILANYKKMTLTQISFKLDICTLSIRNFLYSRGITDYKRYTSPMALTDSDRKYIMAHYKSQTMKEMSMELKKPYYSISNFLRDRGLRGKRERA